MAKIKKVGKDFFGDYYEGDRRMRPNLGPYKDVAQSRLNDLLAMRSFEKNGNAPKDIAWFIFRQKYLPFREARMNATTYDNDKRAFDMVEKYGRPLLRLSQMTPEYLDDFWVKCKTHKTKPLSDRTISGYVRCLKTAMYQARRWGLAPMQDWDLVKCLADNKRTDYLSYPEFQKVVAACEGRFQRAAMLMGFGGLRRGEVLHVEWSDIDFKNHVIYIRAKPKMNWAPKGSKPGKPKERVVDMTNKLEVYLQSLPKEGRMVIGGELMDKHKFSKYFRDLGRVLGVRLFPHKFRHTCGTYLASNGVNPKVIGELLGQWDQRSTDIYSHIMPHARRDAVDRMDAGLGPMTPPSGGQI